MSCQCKSFAICQKDLVAMEQNKVEVSLNPIQDEPFLGCSRPPYLKSVRYILQLYLTYSYILPTEDLKKIKIT